jgi:hypothetical protein
MGFCRLDGIFKQKFLYIFRPNQQGLLSKHFTLPAFCQQWAIPKIFHTHPVEEPWNLRKLSCKIYPFPWNFLVKITLPHGISI